MQENTKKIMIRIMNTISLIGNIGTIFFISVLTILAKYADQIPELSEFTEIISNSNVSILQQAIILGLCIIFSIVNLILSKNIQKNENKIAFFMAISMMMGSIYNIIAGFVCIIMIYKKRNGEEKEEVRKTDDIKTLKRLIYASLFVIIFIVFYTSIMIDLLPDFNPWLQIIIFYGGRVVFAIIPFFTTLKRDFKDFINNRKEYLKEFVKILSITLLFYVPVALIVNLITGNESTNQSLIKEIPLWLTAILAVIIAPISEEILFRGFIRKVFKNDLLFIIISGIIFGIIHCMYAEENLLMYLYILPYSVMGAGFAKLYTKTNNICTNILIHFIWNAIAMVAMIVLSIG